MFHFGAFSYCNAVIGVNWRHTHTPACTMLLWVTWHTPLSKNTLGRVLGHMSVQTFSEHKVTGCVWTSGQTGLYPTVLYNVGTCPSAMPSCPKME